MVWLGLLRKAVKAEGGQAAVARKLGYSPAAISLVLAGNYNGSTEAIAAKVLEIYGGKRVEEKIPDGFMQDAKGRLVPVGAIKERDLLCDDLVKGIVKRAKGLSDTVRIFKEQTAGDIDAFVQLSGEKYGVRMGGAKGNLSIVSFDGRYKVCRAISDHIEPDERIDIAKQLFDECVHEWSEGARVEIRALVMDAFNVDKKGKINLSALLRLRSINIDDDKWRRAMDALNDSLQVIGSSVHIRVYERLGTTDKYELIVTTKLSEVA
jgi:hypothetical protein